METGYVMHNKLLDLHKALRIIAFILFIGFYGLAVTGFVFAFLNSTNNHQVAVTSIEIIFDVVSFIISVLPNDKSSSPVSFLFLLNALHAVYCSNLAFQNGSAYTFTVNVFVGIASVAQAFNFGAIIGFNTTELSFKPLFNGTNPAGNP